MTKKQPWFEQVVTPALLRHARVTYGVAMRTALADAGYDDIPKNGLYVIGGLALGAGDVPLGVLVRELRISKQAAGQLVDTLVMRGYLHRAMDEHDRRNAAYSVVVTLVILKVLDATVGLRVSKDQKPKGSTRTSTARRATTWVALEPSPSSLTQRPKSHCVRRDFVVGLSRGTLSLRGTPVSKGAASRAPLPEAEVRDYCLDELPEYDGTDLEQAAADRRSRPRVRRDSWSGLVRSWRAVRHVCRQGLHPRACEGVLR